MLEVMRPTLMAAFIATTAGWAAAQPAVPMDAVSPAAAADLTYRSAFENYRAFTDEKVGSWADANATVRNVGGWREYAKEAQRPAPEEADRGSGNSGAAPAPAADPHAGHGKQ